MKNRKAASQPRRQDEKAEGCTAPHPVVPFLLTLATASALALAGLVLWRFVF